MLTGKPQMFGVHCGRGVGLRRIPFQGEVMATEKPTMILLSKTDMSKKDL